MQANSLWQSSCAPIFAPIVLDKYYSLAISDNWSFAVEISRILRFKGTAFQVETKLIRYIIQKLLYFDAGRMTMYICQNGYALFF